MSSTATFDIAEKTTVNAATTDVSTALKQTKEHTKVSKKHLVN